MMKQTKSHPKARQSVEEVRTIQRLLGGRPAGFIENFETGYASSCVMDGEVRPLTPAERVAIARARERREIERAAYLTWLRVKLAMPIAQPRKAARLLVQEASLP
jgi:hypothetical protein